MKRSALRSRPSSQTPKRPWIRAEDDKVTPDLRAFVLKRDGGCIARHYDDPANCWGRVTLDHVKDSARMGVRAESDQWHLVSVCQGHSEDGRKAGYQWNTANRSLEREYLEGLRER